MSYNFDKAETRILELIGTVDDLEFTTKISIKEESESGISEIETFVLTAYYANDNPKYSEGSASSEEFLKELAESKYFKVFPEKLENFVDIAAEYGVDI